MKYILVGSALFNWSETQRMIEISDELTRRGYQIVFVGKGKYDFLLEEKGYIREHIAYDEKWYTPDRITKMLDMDRHGNNYATLDEIENIIASEVEVIQKYKPAALLTGYRMTLTVSARLCNIPIIWSLSATMSKLYLISAADRVKHIDKLKRNSNLSYQELRTLYEDKIACERLLKECRTSAVWNRFLQDHDLPPFDSDLGIYTGDLNLMSDAGELFPELTENEHYKFIGPILNNQYIPMPEIVETVMNEHNGRKKVLISIGSGGKKELFLKILRSTLDFDCDFFISVVGILSEDDLREFPPNYHFCEKFPLIEIAQKCDLAIIQGGQGTLYAMLAARCPFVALPATFEQKHNVQNLFRHYSCGELIVNSNVTTQSIKAALTKLLEDPSYKESAIRVAKDIEHHTSDRQRTPTTAADCIEELLRS